MRKRTGILFGRRITRILEKGKWQIFLVGERKISFFKKKEQEKKAREQRRFSKRGLAAHMENRGRRKIGIHDFVEDFQRITIAGKPSNRVETAQDEYSEKGGNFIKAV